MAALINRRVTSGQQRIGVVVLALVLTAMVGAVSSEMLASEDVVLVPDPGIARAAGTQTFTVVNTNDAGAGSLRQAILDCNKRFFSDTRSPSATIRFNIPGTPRIQPLSPLPTVECPVLIDGTTQPGYSGTPLIDIYGKFAGQAIGLYMHGSGSVVRALYIWGFEGPGVLLGAANQIVELGKITYNQDGVRVGRVYGAAIRNNEIRKNYYAGVQLVAGGGHRLDGNRIESNQRGVVPYNSENNLITNNQIRLNTQEGIYMLGAGAEDNQIRGNVVEDNLGNGIFVAVGSPRAITEGNTVRRNVNGIVTNNAYDFVANANIVEDNQKAGIVLSTDYADVKDNVIRGHSLAGLRIIQGSYNTVNGNTITGNPGDGVYVYGDFNTGTGNTITGNGRNVFIAGGQGNAIG